MEKRTPKLQKHELVELVTFAKALARGGGAIAMSCYGRARPSFKYDETLVTEADIAVQDYIRSEIAAAYPNHKFLGEEGIVDETITIPEEPLWVVDPVDGTAAFSAAMPIWGVAISLFDNGVPVLGVYYQPVTEELYSAIKGGPAYLNDVPIKVRKDDDIDNQSLLLTYSRFNGDFTTSFPGKIRSMGSSIAHIVYTARGAAWGALLGNVHVWDVAAGMVILEAAGGSIKTLDNKEWDITESLTNPGGKIDGQILASAKGQHKLAGRYFNKIS